MKKYDLTILVPVYNEEATLKRLLQKLDKVSFSKKVQVIIVDDGSTDNSRSIIESWIKTNPSKYQIKYIKHKSNKGKGSGIQTGLQHAAGKYFVIQDADLEYNPAEIPRLLKKALDLDTPVVYGSRFMGKISNMPKPNYYANKFYNYMIYVLYGYRMTDMHTCYKMLKTELFKDLNINSDGFGYATEVVSALLKRKIDIIEVPISYNGRTIKEGKKITVKDGIECLAQLVAYRFK